MVKSTKCLLRQYVIVTSVSFSGIGLGMTLSWTSPMLVKLTNEDTQLSKQISEEEGSWIVSIGFLVAIFFCPVYFWLVDLFGRKKIMICFSLIRATVNLMYIFATEVWMLYAIRGITAIFEIGILTNIPSYNAEIASKQIRGALGTFGQIAIAIGMLIMLSVGPYASYLVVNIVYASIVIIVIIPLFFIPDSPYCMMRRGETENALKTLTYLRGSELLAQEEMKELTSTYSQNFNKTALFKDIIFLKTLAIVAVLSIGVQSAGYIAVALYLQTILETTNTNISPNIVSVIFGMMQILACFVTAVLSDKAGRKPILALTLVGISLGMIGLGFFFQGKESGDEISGFMNYLPLISLILIVICYNAGIGSLCIVLSAELFDNSTRSIGVSISMVFTMLCGFLNLKFFPILTSMVGITVVFWIFSVNCLLFLIFILFCVPETKQKSFLEIQRALGRNVDY